MIKINTLLIIGAVISGVYAAMVLLMPEKFLEMRGITTDASGIFETRLIGCAMVGYCLLGFTASKLKSREALLPVAIAFAGYLFVTCVVLLIGKMTMPMNNMAWADIGITLVFSLAFVKYIFSKPKA